MKGPARTPDHKSGRTLVLRFPEGVGKYRGAIILTTLILLCGCSSIRQDMVTPESCVNDDPVIGTWVHDPGSADSPLFLYIFKEYGRFDAVALPRDAVIPLPYEEWITGTWTVDGTEEYVLEGEVIRNEFMTGSHTALPFNETLFYDPGNEILVNRAQPAGVYHRYSHEPVIPPGMDISIPWD